MTRRIRNTGRSEFMRKWEGKMPDRVTRVWCSLEGRRKGAYEFGCMVSKNVNNHTTLNGSGGAPVAAICHLSMLSPDKPQDASIVQLNYFRMPKLRNQAATAATGDF